MTDSSVSDNTEVVTEPVLTRKHHSPPYLAITALLLAIIALLIAGYAIFNNVSLQQSLGQGKQDLQADFSNIKQQQNDFQKRLNNKIAAARRQQNKLQENYTNLHKSIEATLQERFYQTQDWLLLKARYYLELAQINAHWSNNIATTQALLEQADTILAGINDQNLFTVRQAIATEISQVKSLPKVDSAGILSRLDAAQTMVDKLPINSVSTGLQKEESSSTSVHDKTWKSRFQDSLSQLQKLVVIRHHTEDIVPLLSAEQVSLIRENIRLNLQEAQWAVLQLDEELYQLTLKQAITSINRSFQINADSTQALVKQLQDLQGIKLTQDKPAIDQSLTLLNQVISSPKPSTNVPSKQGDNQS